MATAQALDVDRLVDEQKFSGFNLKLLIWSFLALFADGFEISSLGLAAPHLIREWDVPASAMGPMMSGSLVGIFIGAPLLGYLGDRYGRRFVIILGCFIFGFTTLAVVWATDITQITILRVLAGIGMGGLLPNTIALSSESSPARLRARLIILMFMGITTGSSVPGFVAIWLVPIYGWKIIFLLGGVVPLLIGAGLIFGLPESVKYLVRRPEKRRQLVTTLRRMRPDLTIADDARFVVPPAPAEGEGGVRPIFVGGLASVTLLLWVCFATTLMANYFLNSWMAVLFEDIGATPAEAAFATTVYHFGGLAGGLMMSLLLDRFGFLAMGVLLLLAAPALLLLGIPGLPVPLLIALVTFAGFAVLGAQFGGNAAAGLIYPTDVRSKGVGLAFAAGRIGSVVGPIIGAMMFGLKLPMIWLLLTMAGPLLFGALAAFILARITHRRFGGWRIREIAPAGRD